MKETDVNFIDRLEEDLEIYSDVFYAYYEDTILVVEFDPYDKIKYDEFCKSFEKFKSQLKPDYPTYFEMYNRFMNSDDSDYYLYDSDTDSYTKIKNKQGELTYNNPESANYWSTRLLWPKK